MKKRTLGLWLVCMLSISLCCFSVSAAEVEMTGNPAPDNTLTITCDSAATYQWSVDGTPVPGATTASYEVTWDDLGKTISCMVTPTGESAVTKEITVPAQTLKNTGRYGNDKRPADQQMGATSSETLFTVGGQKFILLDTKNVDSSKFFVMSEEVFPANRNGTNEPGEFDAPGSDVRFDVDRVSNIGYMLNTTIRGKLPKDIVDNINDDYIWITEAAHAGHGIPQYTTQAGIAVMSQTEWYNYAPKYGLKPASCNNNDGWWLRTSNGATADRREMLKSATDGQLGQTQQNEIDTGKGYLRPVFHLGRDFFTNVHIPVQDMGADVRAALLATYEAEELLEAGYSRSELTEIGFVLASNAEIEGTAAPDNTLTMVHEGTASAYQWYVGGEEVPGVTGATYEVTWADLGKTVKAVATTADGPVEATIAIPMQEFPARGRYNNSDKPAVQQTGATSSETLFTVGGQKFILLDTKNVDSSKFFVMSEEVFPANRNGTNEPGEFGAVGEMKFDVDSETNIGYFLNSETFRAKLPKDIVNNINNDYIWITEAAHATWDIPQYTTQAGIAVMSQTEWYNYAPKYGLKPASCNNNDGWWLRTSNGVNGDLRQLLKSATDGMLGQTQQSDTGTGKAYLRPVFHLGRDFFTNVHISVQDMGTEVRAALLATYEADELLEAGYSRSELVQIGFDLPIEAEITGTAAPDNTLTMTHDGTASSYQWYSGETLVAGATGATYEVTWNDLGKTIKAVATTAEGTKEATIAIPMQEFKPMDRVGSRPEGVPDQTDAKYLFTVGGQKFILLDTKNVDSSKFLVMAENEYGAKAFDPDLTGVFDPSDTNNIANYMNGSEFKALLPTDIVSHINTNYYWITEPSHANLGIDQYAVQAGIVVPSQTEWSQYAGKFGLIPGGSAGNDGWWLRTVRGTASDKIYMLRTLTEVNEQLGQTHQLEPNIATCRIRPMFHLNRDFFLDVELDVSTLGSEVCAAIRDTYTKEEMAATGFYTEEELLALGYSTNVTITGLTYEDGEGQPLTTLVGATEIVVEASVKNETADSADYVMIVGLYDENGAVSAMTVKSGIVDAKSTTEPFTVSLTPRNTPTEGYKLRVFLWEDLLSMVPYGRALDFVPTA